MSKKRLTRLAKRGALLLLGLLILLAIALTIAWQVLREDHDYVIRRLQETAHQKWNADLELQGYQLQWIKPFPLIELQLKGFSYGLEKRPQQPILKFNHATSEFNPWNLITKDFNAHPLRFDSVWVHLYTDPISSATIDTNQREKASAVQGINQDIDELPNITCNYLDFQREDHAKDAWQRAELTQFSVVPQRHGFGDWSAHLKSDCHFEGLLFKPAEGAFLKNVRGQLDLNFDLVDRGKSILLEPSSLQVDQATFLLSGKFSFDKINQLALIIENKSALLDEVLPLLAPSVNQALGDIQIDQPIAAKFSLTNNLHPDNKGAILVEFSTQSAQLDFKEVSMSDVTLQGNFTNDTDGDGIGIPESKTITIDQLDGNLLGLIPVQLAGMIDQLKDPWVTISGRMDINMPRLNSLLAAKDKVTFTAGQAVVNFEYDGKLLNVLNSPFDESNIRIHGDANFDAVTLATASDRFSSPSLSGNLSFDENSADLDDIALQWMGSAIKLKGELSNLPEFLFYEDEALISDVSLHFDKLDINKFIKTSTSTAKNKKRKPLNVEAIDRMTRRLASNLNGQLKLEIDKVLYDTLFFTDFKTQFSLFTPRKIEYIDSTMINMQELTTKFMGISPMTLDLSLAQDSTTHVILNIDMPSAVETVNIFLPATAEISNGELGIHLIAQAPLRSLLNSKSLLRDLHLDGQLKFDQVDLDLSAMDWPVRKISGDVIFDNNLVLLDEVHFQYDDSPFEAHGTIANYSALQGDFTNKAQVDLFLKGHYLNLKGDQAKAAKAADTPALTPAELFQSLDTIYNLATGKIDLFLDSILTTNHKIKPFLLQAQLLPDLNSNAYQLKVDSFNFGLGKKNYVKGNFSVINPEQPFLDAQFLARMKFDRVGDFLKSDYLKFKKGYFKLDLNYQTPLYDTINATNYLLNATVDGKAAIVNGKLFYNYRDFTFDNIYGHLDFDQRALYIRDIALEINDNKVSAIGESSDFFPFFILPDRKAHIKLALNSPRFDFGNFTAPHGLGKDSLVTTFQSVINNGRDTILVPVLGSTDNVVSQTASFIDQLLDKGSLEMTTSVDEMIYNKFKANAIKGVISLAPDTVQLNQLQMQVADGQLNVDGLISDIIFHAPKLQLALQMRDNNIREIFRQFDDFGQENISFKHVQGIASAQLDFQAVANSDYSILKETMFGDLRVQLLGGQLSALPALTKLKGFLFNKRQLHEVLIDTIDIYTHVRGPKLYIDNFYLHASSFDMEAEGVYHLESKDSTRLLWTVPMGNLFKRHITWTEMQSGLAKRKGMPIFLESRYKKDKMRMRWRPFVGRKKRYQLLKPEDEK